MGKSSLFNLNGIFLTLLLLHTNPVKLLRAGTDRNCERKYAAAGIGLNRRPIRRRELRGGLQHIIESGLRVGL